MSSRVASRYAKSLIELAQENGKLDQIFQDITYLDEALVNRDLQLFIKSPIIHAAKKKSVFKALFDRKLDQMTHLFVNLLITKGRESQLKEIVHSFISQYKAINNISTVHLTTAAPLSDAALSVIKSKLASNQDLNGTIEIESKTDPKLIGGFKLEFDGQLYDSSVIHQLEKIRKSFINT